MVCVNVRRVSAPNPKNSTKFCVNSDWENPQSLSDAILTAKRVCFDDLIANREPESAICSTETGEVLLVVTLSNDLVFSIERFVYVCDSAGNLLHAANGADNAISWINDNGYRVTDVRDNRIIVTDSAVWFDRG